MEQHPVPRNISSFQFRLIGDMTVRQFGYLSAGVISGYLFYRISFLPGVVTLVISLTIGLIGFAFAFLPIAERPLDKWLAAFIRSILSPTRFLWQKNNPPPEILLHPSFASTKVIAPVHYQYQKEAKEKLHAYLLTLPVPPQDALNQEEKNYIEKTMAMFDLIPKVAVSAVFTESRSAIPSPVPLSAVNITPAPSPQSAVPTPTILQVAAVPAVSPLPDLEQKKLGDQLQKTLKEKEELEKQLKKLRGDLARENSPQVIKPQNMPQGEKTSTVYTLKPQEVKTEVGITNFPQTPNLLSGAIKDPQRKMLPNIIITIKDKSGMPLRALKTNKLGQFATATPLPNGTYLICPEDPLKRYVFDMAEITLFGKIFSPVELIAKGEKELIREQLTKQLFGSANI